VHARLAATPPIALQPFASVQEQCVPPATLLRARREGGGVG
jgi:hypothetical protein